MTKQHGGAGDADGVEFLSSMIPSPLLIGHNGALGLDMSAESLAHRRKNFFCKCMLATRAKARVERRGQDCGGDCLIDGGLDSPARLSGILDEPLIGTQRRILGESRGREIQQPRCDDAAAAPNLRYIGDVEMQAIRFREGIAGRVS
jgi:hypothetical protein